ncbi:hypothetical protein [Agriterribacter sp.]|jgi:hypothetical protein|uniref:hypothetical protein n=1 Tax=Agriterribacter sp. TaxID=2821509 RepID=UPI002B6EF998|nr:hypothetical protein [Agriterribacter sp.]HRO45938.1 hypothetical protein [Agriterribacter sp.]HRQ18396.1 hypothetical protein [Agriterribacter sp.]
MATVYDIRRGLIDKILAIQNKEFLQALDQLIVSSNSGADIVETTPEQKLMLEMSEDDIKNGRLISQEAMNKRNLEWLNEM